MAINWGTVIQAGTALAGVWSGRKSAQAQKRAAQAPLQAAGRGLDAIRSGYGAAYGHLDRNFFNALGAQQSAINMAQNRQYVGTLKNLQYLDSATRDNLALQQRTSRQNLDAIRRGANEAVGSIRRGTDQNIGWVRRGADQAVGTIDKESRQAIGVADKASRQNLDYTRRATDRAMSDLRSDTGRALEQERARFDFTRDLYNNEIRPMKAEVTNLNRRLIDDFLASSGQQRAFAQDQSQLYRDSFRPLEQQMAADAMGYDGADNINRRAGMAAAGVNQQFSNAAQQKARQFSRYGLNPNSSTFAAQAGADARAQALAAAGAQTNAAFDTMDKAIELRARAAPYGRNVAASAMDAYERANQAGRYASEAGMANLQASNFGADMMRDAYGSYGDRYMQRGQLLADQGTRNAQLMGNAYQYRGDTMSKLRMMRGEMLGGAQYQRGQAVGEAYLDQGRLMGNAQLQRGQLIGDAYLQQGNRVGAAQLMRGEAMGGAELTRAGNLSKLDLYRGDALGGLYSERGANMANMAVGEGQAMANAHFGIGQAALGYGAARANSYGNMANIFGRMAGGAMSVPKERGGTAVFQGAIGGLYNR